MVYNYSRVVYNQTYVSLRKPQHKSKRFLQMVYNEAKKGILPFFVLLIDKALRSIRST